MVLWDWRRERLQAFKCLGGLILKQGFAPVWLVIEVLHKRLQAVFGLW